jgi:uncharacterized protein (DUF1778 family)
MRATRVLLTRHELETIRKAARGTGMTPGQFIVMASVENAKSVLERIEDKTKRADSAVKDSRRRVSNSKPQLRRRRRQTNPR